MLIWTFCFGTLVTIVFVTLKILNWKVQCWFCGFFTRVPWRKKNSFVCQQCGQYNGFTRDGDYNKIIPSQFQSELNPICRYQANSTFKSHSNILCLDCANNQAIIVQKLSEYVPKYEDSDEELKRYAHMLELTYGLCDDCHMKVNDRVRKLDSKLLPSFIEWWHEKRRRTPVTENPVKRKTRRKYLAWLELLIVVRILSIICFACIITGPLLTEISRQTCLVHVMPGNKSYTYKFVEVFWSKPCRQYSRDYCSQILAYSQHLSLSSEGQLWFTSLLLCLQATLIIIDGFHLENAQNSHQLSMYRHGVKSCTLLYNVLVLLISANILLSLLMNYESFRWIIDHQTPHFLSSNFSVKICFLLGFIFLLLIVIILFVIKIWSSFFLKDFKSQHKTLKETWPNDTSIHSNSNNSASFRRIIGLQSSDSISYYSTPTNRHHHHHPNSSIISSQGSLNSSRKSLEDEMAATRISPIIQSTNTFRPSVLESANSYCPSVTGSYYSVVNPPPHHPPPPPPSLFSTHSAMMGRQRVESLRSNEDGLSCLSSVSRCNKANSGYYTCNNNNNNNSNDHLKSISPTHSTRSTSGKRRSSGSSRRKRRTGLIRFILFLLFGRLETRQDVLYELTCLANAVLLSIVIYCTCRLMFCLISIFGI
ncbi:unnamed protein product [Trichobilharzia szidati]|nr:unnamed protein product [Trichobilharzia szidati]